MDNLGLCAQHKSPWQRPLQILQSGPHEQHSWPSLGQGHSQCRSGANGHSRFHFRPVQASSDRSSERISKWGSLNSQNFLSLFDGTSLLLITHCLPGGHANLIGSLISKPQGRLAEVSDLRQVLEEPQSLTHLLLSWRCPAGAPHSNWVLISPTGAPLPHSIRATLHPLKPGHRSPWH